MPELNTLGPQVTYAVFVVIHWKAQEWWLIYEIVSVPNDCLLHLKKTFTTMLEATMRITQWVITWKKELDCFGYTWTRETDVHVHVHVLSYFYYYS